MLNADMESIVNTYPLFGGWLVFVVHGDAFVAERWRDWRRGRRAGSPWWPRTAAGSRRHRRSVTPCACHNSLIFNKWNPDYNVLTSKWAESPVSFSKNVSYARIANILSKVGSIHEAALQSLTPSEYHGMYIRHCGERFLRELNPH